MYRTVSCYLRFSDGVSGKLRTCWLSLMISYASSRSVVCFTKSPPDLGHVGLDFKHGQLSLNVPFCTGWPLSGKPGNVREFDSCQGNVMDLTENQGIVREKILSGKSCLKLFIVNCVFVSILVFSRSLLCLKCYVYGFGWFAVAFLPSPLTVTLAWAWYK